MGSKKLERHACYFILLAAIAVPSCQRAPQSTADQQRPQAADAKDAGKSGTEIPANTSIWVELEKALDSSKLKVGEGFSGKLAEAVIVDGKDVIPKGATVKGHVTNRQTAQGQGSSGLLSLELDSVTFPGGDYHLVANPLTLEAPPLKQTLPPADKANQAVPAVENAYAPKKGVLQFFLSEPLRVKS